MKIDHPSVVLVHSTPVKRPKRKPFKRWSVNVYGLAYEGETVFYGRSRMFHRRSEILSANRIAAILNRNHVTFRST